MTEPATQSNTASTAEPRGAGKRGLARLAAVQALYQIELTSADPGAVVSEFLAHRLGREIDGDQYAEADRGYFADLVKGCSERCEDVDGIVAAALPPDWPLARLESVLRAILRAGTYELLARSDVPARVAINEYVEIAHAFFSGKEPGMVNGVLDRIARTLREAELSRTGRDGGAEAR
ncbi:MAG TPA: transcription antitermination factor NusB [Stellaceae bacterium]|nr:transcription antitermination factor NusB [Stellaceae bacterium]